MVLTGEGNKGFRRAALGCVGQCRDVQNSSLTSVRKERPANAEKYSHLFLNFTFYFFSYVSIFVPSACECESPPRPGAWDPLGL